MNVLFYRILILLALPLIFSFKFDHRSGYPKPEGVHNLLFYTQRNMNTNTVVYELNLDERGDVNEKEPIKVYWINYAKDGKQEPLTQMERNRAFGVEAELTDPERKSFRFHFVSYRKKQLFLMRSPFDNQYHVFCNINNNLIFLDRIFIHIVPGPLGVPKVQYAEIAGKDPATGEEVTERIIF